jgi:hypothetical protein
VISWALPNHDTLSLDIIMQFVEGRLEMSVFSVNVAFFKVILYLQRCKGKGSRGSVDG